MRIVSLLPSSTEIAAALGAADELVGISHECDFPAAITDRPVLTSSKINVDQLSADIDRDVRRVLRRGRHKIGNKGHILGRLLTRDAGAPAAPRHFQSFLAGCRARGAAVGPDRSLSTAPLFRALRSHAHPLSPAPASARPRD